MTVPRELIIRYEQREVATVLHDGDQLGIAYAASWIASGFPISLSLPLAPEPIRGGAAHAFLKNLLPEGQAREAVCRKLGISVENDFALLRAIGGECAGALAITEPDARRPASDDDAYEELGDKRLQALAANDTLVPLLVGGPPTRLSLAGAQDKLPVAVFDDKIYLPLEGAASTHILKLPHRTFKHVPLNEMFVMGLAAKIGLATARAELVVRTDPPSLLVERYDRVVEEGDHVRRLHQEDLCQAFGISPLRKYEDEGGPTLSGAIALVRQHVAHPLIDVRRLLEWQAFNVVVGNSDGHGKNLSLLYRDRGVELAPFYDLLSTRQYPALERRLAMSVGSRRDATELHRAQWEELARDAGIQSRTVVELVRDVAERTHAELAGWTKEYRDRYGRRAILETLPAWITKNAKRVLRQLT